MPTLPQEGLNAALIGGGGALLGFLIKWALERFKHDSEATETKIEGLTKELHLTTIAITELRIELKHITEALSLVKELERDINKLGHKLREKFDG